MKIAFSSIPQTISFFSASSLKWQLEGKGGTRYRNGQEGYKSRGRPGYNIIRRQMAYSSKKDYKPINDKAIIPLTLLQINNQLTEDSIFDGQSFYTLSIVGRL